MSQPVASYNPIPPAPTAPDAPVAPAKSFLVTWLLALFLGSLGADRFYLGKIGTAVAKLVTLGGLGIWTLVDLILVLTGSTTDKNGQRLAGYDAKKLVAWIVTAAIVVLGGIGGIVIGITTAAALSTLPDRIIEQIDEDAGVPVEDDGTGVELDGTPESVVAWADETYGTFEQISETGSGDTVITLPAGATAGLVRATYTGTANFSILVLDADNQPTGDLMANSLGEYAGITAYGLLPVPGNEAVSLKVTASGPWTIDVAPMNYAPGPATEGFGDDVFIYAGDPLNVAMTHDGSANFVVMQYTDDVMGLAVLVNDIGAYEGTVPLSQGPLVLSVKADGNWTMTEQ